MVSYFVKQKEIPSTFFWPIEEWCKHPNERNAKSPVVLPYQSDLIPTLKLQKFEFGRHCRNNIKFK